MHPNNYKTLRGLTKATENILKIKKDNPLAKIPGMSIGLWLINAKYHAKTHFNAENTINDLIKKYAITKIGDLLAIGESALSSPFENIDREYIEGDNIPGVGIIQEIYGEQYRINNQWYHKRCFGK